MSRQPSPGELPQANADDRVVGQKSARDEDDVEVARDGSAPCPPVDQGDQLAQREEGEAEAHAQEEQQQPGGEGADQLEHPNPEAAGNAEADDEAQPHAVADEEEQPAKEEEEAAPEDPMADVQVAQAEWVQRLEAVKQEAAAKSAEFAAASTALKAQVSGLERDVQAKTQEAVQAKAFQTTIEQSLKDSQAKEQQQNSTASSTLCKVRQQLSQSIEDNCALALQLEAEQRENLKSQWAAQNAEQKCEAAVAEAQHWRRIAKAATSSVGTFQLGALDSTSMPTLDLDVDAEKAKTAEVLISVRSTVDRLLTPIKQHLASNNDSATTTGQQQQVVTTLVKWVEEAMKEREALVKGSADQSIEIRQLQHQLSYAQGVALESQQLLSTGQLPLLRQQVTIQGLQELGAKDGRLTKAEGEELRRKLGILEQQLEAASVALRNAYGGAAAPGPVPVAANTLYAGIQTRDKRIKRLEAELAAATKKSAEEVGEGGEGATGDPVETANASTLRSLCRRWQRVAAEALHHLEGVDKAGASGGNTALLRVEVAYLRKQCEVSALHNSHLAAENDVLRILSNISEDFHRCLVTNFHSTSAEDAVAKVRKSWKDTYAGHHKKMETLLNEGRAMYATKTTEFGDEAKGLMNEVTELFNAKEKQMAWRLAFAVRQSVESDRFIATHLLGEDAAAVADFQKHLDEALNSVQKLELPSALRNQPPTFAVLPVPMEDVRAKVEGSLSGFRKTLAALQGEVKRALEHKDQRIQYYEATPRRQLVEELEKSKKEVEALHLAESKSTEANQKNSADLASKVESMRTENQVALSALKEEKAKVEADLVAQQGASKAEGDRLKKQLVGALEECQQAKAGRDKLLEQTKVSKTELEAAATRQTELDAQVKQLRQQLEAEKEESAKTQAQLKDSKEKLISTQKQHETDLKEKLEKQSQDHKAELEKAQEQPASHLNVSAQPFQPRGGALVGGFESPVVEAQPAPPKAPTPLPEEDEMPVVESKPENEQKEEPPSHQTQYEEAYDDEEEGDEQFAGEEEEEGDGEEEEYNEEEEEQAEQQDAADDEEAVAGDEAAPTAEVEPEVEVEGNDEEEEETGEEGFGGDW